MAAHISKREAKEADLVKVKNERTGEVLRVVSPHDFIVGISDLMESDIRVTRDAYISGSLYVKHGASGTLVLPDGTPALRAGSDIQIVDDGDGGFTINSLASGGSGVALAPKNSPYITYAPTGDLTNEKVLNTSGPLTFDASTATLGFNSAASLTVSSLTSNALTLSGVSFSSIPVLAVSPSAAIPGAKILGGGSGISISTAGSDTTVSVDSTVVRTSGATFTGIVSAPTLSSTTANLTNVSSTSVTAQKLTGSLTKLQDGSDYLRAGTNVTLSTGSDGSITISAPAASGAPLAGRYLLLDSIDSGLLTHERILGLGSGLVSSDAGPGGIYTLSVSDSQVAFLTGASFSGPVTSSNFKSYGNVEALGDVIASGDVTAQNIFSNAKIFSPSITGSITQLADGTPYIKAGKNVEIITGSNGSITISAETGSYMTGTFLMHRPDANFPNSLAIIEGDGIQFDEDEECANLIVSAKLGAGPGIELDILPTRQIIISSIVGEAISSGSFILASASNDFPSGRVITSSLGLKIVDGGPSAAFDITVDPSQVAFLTGAHFTGPVQFDGEVEFTGEVTFGDPKFYSPGYFYAGLSGSLTTLIDGSPYLVAGPGISISTGSNGSITISNDGTVGDINEVIAGLGLTGGGLSGSVSLHVDPLQVAFLTGSRFTGEVLFEGGLSGSLTSLTDGTPYLIAGDNVEISTGSNGSITISSLASFQNLTGADGVIVEVNGNSATASLDSNAVAFLTGAHFTGLVSFDEGLLAVGLAQFESSSFSAPAIFNGGLSGSLTSLVDGTPYLNAGQGISISTGSNGSITISSTAIGSITASVSVTGRDRETQWVTASSPGGTLFEFQTLDFSIVSFDEDLIEVYLNGQLQHSGSQADVLLGNFDYYVTGTAGVVFGFELDVDDSIDVVVQGGDSAPASTLNEPFITFSSSSNLTNSRILTAGAGIEISTGSSGQVIVSTNGTGGNSSAFLARLAINEQPSGIIDGANDTFTLSRTPSDTSQVMLWLNGQLLSQGPGYDYTIVGNTLTLFDDSVPVEDDLLAVMYPYVEQSSRYILNERVNMTESGGIIQGDLESTPQTPSKLMLFWNGQLMSQGVEKDYIIVGKTIYINPGVLNDILDPDDIFVACYTATANNVYYEINEEITIYYDGTLGLWKGNLTHEPSSDARLMLFMNGQLLRGGMSEDFVLSGEEIVILDDDVEGDFRFYATYEYA
jgi:hypothetical protein